MVGQESGVDTPRPNQRNSQADTIDSRLGWLLKSRDMLSIGLGYLLGVLELDHLAQSALAHVAFESTWNKMMGGVAPA